jgi:hypothetical protein
MDPQSAVSIASITLVTAAFVMGTGLFGWLNASEERRGFWIGIAVGGGVVGAAGLLVVLVSHVRWV